MKAEQLRVADLADAQVGVQRRHERERRVTRVLDVELDVEAVARDAHRELEHERVRPQRARRLVVAEPEHGERIAARAGLLDQRPLPRAHEAMARQRSALVELREHHRHPAAHRLAVAVVRALRQEHALDAVRRGPRDDVRAMQQHDCLRAVGGAQAHGRLALELDRFDAHDTLRRNADARSVGQPLARVRAASQCVSLLNRSCKPHIGIPISRAATRARRAARRPDFRERRHARAAPRVPARHRPRLAAPRPQPPPHR